MSPTLVILLVASCVAASCALIGTFLVLRKMALLGDAISHAVLPGIVIAFLVTGSRSALPMVLGAGALDLAHQGGGDLEGLQVGDHGDALLGLQPEAGMDRVVSPGGELRNGIRNEIMVFEFHRVPSFQAPRALQGPGLPSL